MGSRPEISIPSATISSTSPPYTQYNITIRLPLRSYTVPKRYSDFTTLHSSLTQLVGNAPPSALPSKTWFSKTTSNPELTETRRKDLEAYLSSINTDPDSRWRNTAAWRVFLNLPSSTLTSTGDKAHSSLTGPSGPIIDPTLWLDTHRDLKSQLHNARLHLTSRDQASTPQKQHEASASAKSALVKSGGLLSALDQGLKAMSSPDSSSTQSWGSPKPLGEGELRRRRDLVTSARQEKEGLESLLNAMTAKSKLDSTLSSVSASTSTTAAEKDSLLSTADNVSLSSKSSNPRSGRVLGRETAETRELSNQGLVQLQQQKMADQDLDVEQLRKIVQRQKELGIQINEELEVQSEMLRFVDEDVDRVQGKIDVAKKRVGRLGGK